MKHFVVINDWATENERILNIIGVYHSIEEAKKMFDICVQSERQFAEEQRFTIFADNAEQFDAGKEGYYVQNHTNLYIKMVKNILRND